MTSITALKAVLKIPCSAGGLLAVWMQLKRMTTAAVACLAAAAFSARLLRHVYE
jgi:hypothetical protein